MAVDGNFSLGRNLQVNSYLAKTASSADVCQARGLTSCSGQDMAFYGRVAYRDPRLSMWVNYLDVQDNFNAEAGFVQRRGVRTTKAYFSPTPRPKRGSIKLMEPMYVLTYATDQHNRLVNRLHHLMWGTTLRDDSFINVIYQKNLDVLDLPFNIRPGVRIPIGSYNMNEWILTYNTSPGKRLYQRLTFSPTDFYGGTRRSVSAAYGLRASSRLATELQYNRNDVKMPWGNFLVNLATLRVDYTFSPKMTIRSLSQYNTSTHEFSNNIRFNLIHHAGSDLYVVYNDLRQTGLPADVFAQKDRQLAVKLNYLLQK
jgi:hypothetical protein